MRGARFSNRAERDYRALDIPTRGRVAEALEAIVANPLIGTKLKAELADSWSFRVWPYRILCAFDERQVWVKSIRHRRDVYR